MDCNHPVHVRHSSGLNLLMSPLFNVHDSYSPDVPDTTCIGSPFDVRNPNNHLTHLTMRRVSLPPLSVCRYLVCFLALEAIILLRNFTECCGLD